KEVAEKCVDIFFDNKLDTPTFMGITFTYKSFPEDPTLAYCRLTVPVYYPTDDKTLKIVDVTEDLNKSLEEDAQAEEEAIQEAIAQWAEEMGVDVEDVDIRAEPLGDDVPEDDFKPAYVATDSKNKKLH